MLRSSSAESASHTGTRNPVAPSAVLQIERFRLNGKVYQEGHETFNMIHVSSKALNRLKEYWEESGKQVLRVKLIGGRATLVGDQSDDGQTIDQIVQQDGRQLIISKVEAKTIDEAYIDVDELSEEEPLTIQYWTDGKYSSPEIITFPSDD